MKVKAILRGLTEATRVPNDPTIQRSNDPAIQGKPLDTFQ